MARSLYALFSRHRGKERVPTAKQRRNTRKASPQATPPAATVWPNLGGIHVFLIEDNEDTRALLDETLQHCGAVVSVYSSADAVMADLPEFLPTVFISDLSMPGLDGLQFMRRMRQVSPERGGQVPAIAITAYYEDYAAAEALEAGFNAYMIKPIRLEELTRLVKDLATKTPP
ncbi:MAG: response regulator [Candidatus Rokuibacteriota bacterium]|nr:MAG: response regulator [Candidatus Rokubacteria bacterium]